jgi:hypothetical protein
MICKEDERALPSYEAGTAAELAAVRQGDYNFPGVGLTPDDHAFLAKRRATRTNDSTEILIPCHPAERQEWAATFPRLGSAALTFQTAPPDDDWREHFTVLQRDRDIGLPAALDGLATQSFRDLITSAKTCLRKNLLCLGGWGVCQPGLDDDLHNILARSFVLTGDPVRLYPGEPSRCHQNTATLWQEHRSTAAIIDRIRS